MEFLSNNSFLITLFFYVISLSTFFINLVFVCNIRKKGEANIKSFVKFFAVIMISGFVMGIIYIKYAAVIKFLIELLRNFLIVFLIIVVINYLIKTFKENLKITSIILIIMYLIFFINMIAFLIYMLGVFPDVVRIPLNWEVRISKWDEDTALLINVFPIYFYNDGRVLWDYPNTKFKAETIELSSEYDLDEIADAVEEFDCKAARKEREAEALREGRNKYNGLDVTNFKRASGYKVVCNDWDYVMDEDEREELVILFENDIRKKYEDFFEEINYFLTKKYEGDLLDIKFF